MVALGLKLGKVRLREILCSRIGSAMRIARLTARLGSRMR